jgi:hypothetical protein
MAGYSARQSTFTTGDTITAAHSNNEFNAILAAFHVSTGHKHDGSTAGDGGPISTLFSNAISMGTGADTDIAVTFNANSNDGVITWMEDEDYFQFSDDLLISSTEKIQFRDTAIYINSSADGQLDLVADTEIQIAATTIDMNGNVDVSGTLNFGSLSDGSVTITDIADEDNMSSNSATKLATQQSIKAYVDTEISGVTTSFQLEDSDGTEVTIASGKEVKFIGSGITTNWTDTDNGTDGDPYDLTFSVNAAQTNITSLLATDIKIGEDNETKIDFETADEIHFYAANAEQVYVADGVFGPQTDSDVDLGTTGVRWKDAYIDTVTTTGNVTIGGDLTISGDDLTMATNTAGNLLIADGTNYNPTAVGDLSEISSVANDDVLLAVDSSGGGLKKITRSTLVSGLATSSGIANVAEDSTPQLGGDLDVNGNGLVSTSNGNIALTPNGSGVVRIDGSNGIDMQSGAISIKNSGAQSYVRFYCEVSNAHYAQLQAPAHSDFSGNITLTLPATTDTLVGKTTTDTLTNKTLTTPTIEEIDSGSTITLDATTDIILDADGGDIFFKDAGTTFGSATNTSGNLIIKSGTTTALTFSGANATAAGNLIVTGDLTVNGTTTTVNSTTVTIDDPIFTLGGDSAPGSDDNKDRGIEFRYHTGSAAKVGFFGYDDSASAFTFIPDATNSSEVFSGTAGNVVFGNIAGTLTTAAQTNITSVGALNGGSISSGFGAIDVGSSAITTSGTVTGGTLAGTLSTAAQGNVTSLGTLTTLTVDNVIINGTTIGHTDDTDLMTLSNGGLVVAGTLEATGNITGTLATAAQTNITSTGALDGGSITSGFGAIDNGTSGIRTNTFTAETSIVPDASGGADLGSTSLEWGDLYIADDKKIYLGSDQDISIEYDEDGNDTTAVVAAGGVSMAPHGTGTGNTTELRFQELAANGANYVGFKGPDAISSNEVWVLPNADGTDGQFLKTNGSNTLSWGSVSSGSIQFVADGAISAAGKPVSLTSEGKVQEIVASTSRTYGSDYVLVDDYGVTTSFYGNRTSRTAVHDDAINRDVIFYIKRDDKLYAKVYEVNSNNYTHNHGTEVEVDGSTTFKYLSAGYDPNTNRVLIVYSDPGNSDYLTAKVGTIDSSDNSISFGSATVISLLAQSMNCEFDTSTNNFIVNFADTNNKYRSIPCTITGGTTNTVAFGNSGTAYEPISGTDTVLAQYMGFGIVYMRNRNKFAHLYSNSSQNSRVYGFSSTLSGTGSSATASFTSQQQLDGQNYNYYPCPTYHPQSSHAFVTFFNDDQDDRLEGRMMSMSSTGSLSFTASVDITTSQSRYPVSAVDENTGQAVVMYKDDSNYTYPSYDSRIKIRECTLSSGGDSITVEGAVDWDTGHNNSTYTEQIPQDLSMYYSSTAKRIVTHFDYSRDLNVGVSGVDGKFKSRVYKSSNLSTEEDFVGIAQAAVSDGATVDVKVLGSVDENQSGLNIGAKYYLDGATYTTSGTNNTLMGKALAADKLLITN